MTYNKEDYIIAITLNFLNKLNVNPPLPIDYYAHEDEYGTVHRASFVLEDTVMLVKVDVEGEKVESLINIIFPNKESVILNLYEQGEVSVSYDEQESRRFCPRPGVLRTIELLLEMVDQ